MVFRIIPFNTLHIYCIYRSISFYQKSFVRLEMLDSQRFKHQSKILPLSHGETSASERNLNGYESQLLLFIYIRLPATESSIHMKQLALRQWRHIFFIRKRVQIIYINIYIYMLGQFLGEFNRLEIRVFCLLDQLPYKC